MAIKRICYVLLCCINEHYDVYTYRVVVHENVVKMLPRQLHTQTTTTTTNNNNTNYKKWQLRCIATWRPPVVSPVVLGCFCPNMYCACTETAVYELSD